MNKISLRTTDTAAIDAGTLGSIVARLRGVFTPRDFIYHDGRSLRRLKLGTGTQGMIAATGALLLGFSGYGVAQAATTTGQGAGIIAAPAAEARLVHMERKLDAMQARVGTIRRTAQIHATRIEQRQALLTTALIGKGGDKDLALATLSIDPAAEKLAAVAIKPFSKVEGRQAELARAANAVLGKQLAATTGRLHALGVKARIKPARATGGPLVAAASAEASADLAADAQFRSLFMTWKKLDTLEQGVISIPSVQPVANLSFTSNYGIRSDPFRGTAAMHAGVDIPGATGTPIYATADGIVAHADRQGGYGNLVEINHGKGIATRYGHLSRILVDDNARVKRGQLIALMGSTGRSTGPHLHYEVRIDGRAVNPIPFLTTADYLLAARDRAVGMVPVSTGPMIHD